jgi:hypothetical protein
LDKDRNKLASEMLKIIASTKFHYKETGKVSGWKDVV